MPFTQIRPFCFRNLSEEPIITSAPEVFFIGENGQGKTNILESIYYLCYASSFRVHRDNLMVAHHSSEMAVHGSFEDEEGDSHSISSKYIQKSKSVFLDGKKLHDRKELVHQLPCIVFTHDDMALVTGNPENRRRFFNQTISLYDPLFIDDLRMYSKVLKMRNETLKKRDLPLLDILNQQLATAGLAIQEQRNRLIAEFNETFTPLFAEVAKLPKALSIEYRPSWDISSGFEGCIKQLRESQDHDLLMKTTTSGPHRDRFMFRMDTRDFSMAASTGQIRLITLLLRIAQSIYFSRKTGRKAIFLIDDVLLELDLGKRKSILSLLPSYRQAFFTFLPDEPYMEYANSATLVLSVHGGRVRQA